MLPDAAAGIVSGALLAVARAAGETAPLLFTIGIVNETNTEPVQRPEHRALGADLHATPRRRSPVPQDRAWARRSTLIVIVFVFTILARLVTAFFARRQSGMTPEDGSVPTTSSTPPLTSST